MKIIKNTISDLKERLKNFFSGDNISKSKANEFYAQYLAENIELSDQEKTSFINLYRKKNKAENVLYLFFLISFFSSLIFPLIFFMHTKSISAFNFFIPILLVSTLIFIIGAMTLGTLYNKKGNSMFKKAIKNKSPEYLMLKQKEIIKSIESERINNDIKHFIVNDIYQNLNTPDSDFLKNIYFSDIGAVLTKKNKSEINYKLIDKNHLDLDKKIAFIQNLDIKNKI